MTTIPNNNNPLEQGILNNLFQKRSQVAAVPEQTEEAPIVPINPAELPNNVKSFEQPAQQTTQVVPEVKYPNKPVMWDDEQYEWALQYGMSDDDIKRITSPYDSSKNENYFQRIYESSLSKPAPLDEKKIQNAKIIGHIGDSLGLLSQMWSAGRGAHIRNRDYNQSASAQLSKEEKEMRDKYTVMSNRYEEGLYGAKLKDFMTGMQRYDNDKKAFQSAWMYKKKMEQDGKEAAQKQENWQKQFDFDKEKAQKEEEWENKKFDATEKQRRTQNAISLANINSNKNKSGQNDVIYIRANEKDPNGVFNKAVNGNVIAHQITPNQIKEVASYAKRDKSFINALNPDDYPGLYDKKIVDGEVVRTLANNDRLLAAAYMEYQYNNKWNTQSQQINDSMLNFNMPWQNGNQSISQKSSQTPNFFK